MGPFDDLVSDVQEALAIEGLGGLDEVEVRETLTEICDQEVWGYHIFGACNPMFAAAALDTELPIGSFLPCNVVVHTSGDDDVVVHAVYPEQPVGVADNPELDPISADVRQGLEQVPESVAA